MKLTLKDMREIIGYLEIAKSTTERGIKESCPDGLYYEAMTKQLKKISDLIEKIDNLEV